MASSAERPHWQHLIDGANLPVWRTPTDLANASLNALWQQSAQARIVRSEGVLHLGGAQTADHTARIASLGNTLVALQALVTAVGAAIEGVRTKKGQIRAEVVSRTLLRQALPLAGGSVSITFSPESLPNEELVGKQGVALLDQADEQFVDRCVREALLLLQQAHDLDADADNSAFLQSVIDGGPRVATALRNFAHVVNQADFETETTWRQPSREVQFARFTPADARQVEGIIRARDLDAEPTVLIGRIFASSLSARWQLDLGEPGVVALDMSKVENPLDYSEFPLTQRVEVRAKPRVRTFPDGTEVTTFVAQGIRPLQEEEDNEDAEAEEPEG